MPLLSFPVLMSLRELLAGATTTAVYDLSSLTNDDRGVYEPLKVALCRECDTVTPGRKSVKQSFECRSYHGTGHTARGAAQIRDTGPDPVPSHMVYPAPVPV